MKIENYDRIVRVRTQIVQMENLLLRLNHDKARINFKIATPNYDEYPITLPSSFSKVALRVAKSSIEQEKLKLIKELEDL
jgi:hypothetical protein